MWAQIVNACVGIWLMAAPAVLGTQQSVSGDNDRIVGPVAATFAIVAVWEVTRGLRWVNLPLGLWLVLAPWILGIEVAAAAWNDVVCGIVLAACSLVKGKAPHPFGGGWSVLWRGSRQRNSN